MKLILSLLLFMSMPAMAQEAIYLYNTRSQQTVLDEGSTRVRPIASITKIMTAIVALDHDPDLDRRVRLDPRVGTRLPVTAYTRRDLFNAMLVRSDNAAAETLASDYPGGRTAFMAAMNRRAQRLSMTHTRFYDPSGLSRRNVSTAREVNVMLLTALKYDIIRQASVQKQVLLDSYHGSRVRTIELQNTNRPLLFEFDNVVVSKTGFTRPAGWCVAMIVDAGADTFVVVVLGSRDKYQRANTVKRVLYNHIRDEAIAQDITGWSGY